MICYSCARYSKEEKKCGFLKRPPRMGRNTRKNMCDHYNYLGFKRINNDRKTN